MGEPPGGSEVLEGSAIPRKTGGHIVSESRRKTYKEKFAPAGQTTQMIVGASPESDRQIIRMSEALYRRFTMKRVYFSAYIPVADAPELPSLLTPPPLKREHRLYQADWLLRFYGFSAEEILTEAEPNLDYDLDPKVVWALRHIEVFPIEINTASEAELLRIPGVGNVSVKRIMQHRRVQKIRYEDLKKMGVVLKRARYFLTCDGRYYGGKEQEPEKLRTIFTLEERSAYGGFGTPGLLTQDMQAQDMVDLKLQAADLSARKSQAQDVPARKSQAQVFQAADAQKQKFQAAGMQTPGLQSPLLLPDNRLDGAGIRKALGGGEKAQLSLFDSPAL